MGEIGTHDMIKSKVSSYPYTGSGCPTTAEIEASGTAKVNGSYGNNECLMLENVKAYISPLQLYTTMKVNTTGIINLSGYIYRK